MSPPFFFVSTARMGDDYSDDVFAFSAYPVDRHGQPVTRLMEVSTGRPTEHGRLEGVVFRAEYDAAQRNWPDHLYVGSASDPVVLVSSRVKEVLTSEGVESLLVFPVLLAAGTRGSCARDEPEYHALLPALGLEFECDFDYDSASRETKHAYFRKPLIPRVDTWKGYDLFRAKPTMNRICCTVRFIELARKHRWTNFRFVATDADPEIARRSEGVDYLGRVWPPGSWYPPSFSRGRTVEQCVETFLDRNLDGKTTGQAFRALQLEFKQDAVPPLLRALEYADRRDRLTIATVIVQIAEHTSIEQGVLLNEIVPVLVQFLRTGERVERRRAADRLRALGRLIEIDATILAEAEVQARGGV